MQHFEMNMLVWEKKIGLVFWICRTRLQSYYTHMKHYRGAELLIPWAVIVSMEK